MVCWLQQTTNRSRQTSEAKANDTQFRFQRLPNIYFTARNIIWVAQADENIIRNILGQHRELIVQLSVVLSES